MYATREYVSCDVFKIQGTQMHYQVTALLGSCSDDQALHGGCHQAYKPPLHLYTNLMTICTLLQQASDRRKEIMKFEYIVLLNTSQS